MENLDSGLEQRVWQRVRGEAQSAPLQALAAAEQNLAAVYLMLSRSVQGPEKAMLRQMFERERSHGRCLNGMSMLSDDRALSVRTVPPANDRPDIALRKCYAQTLKSIREYENRVEDPEYGHVFRHLARQEREHCRMILEILGGWKR